MKKILFLSWSVIILQILCTSCEKQWLGEDRADDPVTNFEYLWQEANNKYTYFDYKGVDWDRVYDTVRPRINAGMSDQELFDVLAEMLFQLKDGHVNLKSPFDRSRNWSWYLDYPANYDQNIVYRNYLGKEHRRTGPLHNQVIDSVLYVYYGSFASTIEPVHVDAIVDRVKGLKGLIIDVRSNGGGSLQNGITLASALTRESFTYARSRVKTGPGAEDYSPWKDMTVHSRDGKKYTGPIILLCNRHSYSASTFFAQMMRTLEHATLMGDQTGGGGGIPAYGELPNGWIYRFSATQTISPVGTHIEGGVPVDIPVEMDPEDEADGIDSIFEAALDILTDR